MELEFKGNEIIMRGKTITELDKFLFGRSRDIDVLIEPITYNKFKELYEKTVKRGYYFLNSDRPNNLYEMLEERLAVRIAKEDTIIPNIELKFTKNEFDKFSIQNRLKVVVNGEQVYISPIEIQIAYKLYLGSDKDVEDKC